MIESRHAKPLNQKSFAAFGDVIEATQPEPTVVNAGRARRHHDLARIELLGDDAHPLISVFRSEKVSLPLRIEMVERHPLGSQAFVPMEGQRFLVIVGPPGDGLSVDALQAFVTDGHQGVNYHAGVWHGVLAPLERGGDFLVVDRGGAGTNCDELTLDRPLNVDV